MRRVKWLLVSSLVTLFGMSNTVMAQGDITFQVDMTVQAGLGNFMPDSMGVSAVGSHNGWGGADLAAFALTDDDGDSVYVGTFNIADGDWLYKFVVTKDGGIVEWESSSDRPFTVAGAADTLAVSEWSQGILFAVDMTAPLAGGATFDSSMQYVAVNGTFNGWGGASRAQSELTMVDGDVWSGRFPVGAADAMYKFTIRNKSDDSIANWENHSDRPIEVGLNGISETVPWDGDPGEQIDVNVTFQADMTVHIDLGNFDPASQGVSAVGTFNGWGDADLEANMLTDDDGDSVYTGTLVVPSGDQNFKFVITEGDPKSLAHWESSDDRPLSLGTDKTDTTLAVSEWSQGINFRVNMSDVLAGAVDGVSLNTDSQYVAVVGTFNGWGGAPREISELTDGDGDGIYEGRHEVVSGGAMYKFTIRNNSDDAVAHWETHSDRPLEGIGIDPVETILVKWDGDPGVEVNATLLFQVDVTPLRDLGLFDETDGDSLVVYGAFNGWNGAALDQSLMRQSLTDPAIFELALPVTRVEGAALEYKYFIKFNLDSDRFSESAAPAGWEEPGSTGGGNRVYSFTSDVQQIVGVQTFNDIITVVPDSATYVMHFTADMRCALRAGNFGDVTSDTLRMDIQDAYWHFFNGTIGEGSSDAGSNPSFPMMDDDGDSVYTVSIPVTGPQQNWVQYKLNWAGLDEAGPGFTTGRRRVRFARSIGTDSLGLPTFAASYDMGIDVWNDDNDMPLTVEDEAGDILNDTAPCPVTPVSVEQISYIPGEYALEQNYPNPFNPTTRIKYTLPQGADVQLVIYNVLGRVVGEMVNTYQQAGSYEVVVDFSNVLSGGAASGVYYYQLRAGDKVLTKRMTLLK